MMLSEKSARNYAAAFAASGMFKNAGNNMTPDQVLVVIMAGQEFGWGPAAALMNIHVIEGRPELSADAQARFIKASGKYEYRVTEHTAEVCEITVLAAETGEIIGVERFTMEDARAQGLAGRKNWKTVPRNMLFARCISNVTAFHCPDALPMRTYALGEVDGFGRNSAEAEEREQVVAPPVSVVAAVQRIEDEVAEQIEDADVEIVGTSNGQPVTEADVQRMADEAEAGLKVEGLRRREGGMNPAELADLKRREDGPDRFSPAAVEERLRRDLPKISDTDKAAIKSYVIDTARLPFTYASLVDVIVQAGFTDVHSWWRQAKGTPLPPVAAEKSPYLKSGMTSRQTGSQTEMRTISDAQIKMLHARCHDARLTEPERKKLLLRYVGVESSKQIPMKDFEDLLAVLKDIAEIPDADTERRSAYI